MPTDPTFPPFDVLPECPAGCRGEPERALGGSAVVMSVVNYETLRAAAAERDRLRQNGSGTLPRRGEPSGGFKDYPDCKGGHSVTCCRPDCRRCHRAFAAQRKSWDEKLLAVVACLVSADRPLPPKAQAVVDHFNPKMNANADADWDRIRSMAEEFNRTEATTNG